MIDGKTVACVITARGGSKGVPRKNLRPVAGKPLIGWTIEAAARAKTVDRVVVTSDDNEILAVARGSDRIEAVRRPPELATDTAKQEDAILHAMDGLEQKGLGADIVVLLAPTNPLRSAALVDEVVTFHARHPKARATLTVVECEHHPMRANVLPADGSMADFMPDSIKWKNRQELPNYYRISGSVCVADWTYFRQEKTFLAAETFAYVTEARAGLDIDSEAELLLADFYLR
jgi:N-acylneuraminate cytidylyltransferase/CMP-N,N'-diacetyllegionaminic acid synthase